MHKVLFISPVPTHPDYAGNRKRILEMYNHLRRIVGRVDFLFIDFEKGDLNAMKAYFGDHFFYSPFYYDGKRTFIVKAFHFLRDTLTIWKNLFYRGLFFLKKSSISYKSNSIVDHYYFNGISDKVRQLCLKKQYTHIFLNYVIFSKIFKDIADLPVFKILDTHDILTDRNIRISGNAKWFSLFPEEETKGFRRADAIIAIQDVEREFIKNRIPNKKVITIGHLCKPQKLYDASIKNTILYVASSNELNIEAINHFVGHVLPQIEIEIAHLQMHIAGSICNKKERILHHKAITFLGEMNDLNHLYSAASLVIEPVKQGTGVKIKLIEALAKGMPTVVYSSTINSFGTPLFESIMASMLVANTDNHFADHVSSLLQDSKKREALSDKAIDFARQYVERNFDSLKSILG